MLRPVVDLWRTTLRWLGAAAVAVLALILGVASEIGTDGQFFLGYLAVVIGLFIVVKLPVRTCARFVRTVWRCRTVRNRTARVHFHPDLLGQFDWMFALTLVSETVQEFEKRFRVRIRRQVILYVLADAARVQDLNPLRGTGFAMPEWDMVVFALDGRTTQTVRHELAHLFAHRWNRFAAALFMEGLAVYLDSPTRWVDRDWDSWVALQASSVSLWRLLNWRAFYDIRNRATH